jgi:hypothetical protein
MSRKKRGPKLVRSEIISVRIDSKLMLATQLAASNEKRTVTSLVEIALEQVLRRIVVSEADGNELNALQVVEQIWDVDEAKRVMLLWRLHPHLLTHEEEVLWSLIWGSTAFSRPRPTGDLTDPGRYVDWDAVHAHWKVLKNVASGDLQPDALPHGKTIAESRLSFRRTKGHGKEVR